jgi:hypothetical protein
MEKTGTIMIADVWHIVDNMKPNRTKCKKSTRKWQIKYLGDLNINNACKECIKIHFEFNT